MGEGEGKDSESDTEDVWSFWETARDGEGGVWEGGVYEGWVWGEWEWSFETSHAGEVGGWEQAE